MSSTTGRDDAPRGIAKPVEGVSAPLRMGVVGLGIGGSHIQAFLKMPDRFQVAAVCDKDAGKAREAADLFGIPRVSDDFAQICAMKDLDVIDICTPSYLHYAHCRHALEAGKHVICEKPLAGSLKEVDGLRDAQEASGRILMPIFQYRFGNGLQKLKVLIQKGVAGPAYLCTTETAWRRREDYYAAAWRGKWKTELGGTLVTHAIHALDLLIHVLGPVRSVVARTATRVHPIEVEDTFSASLEMGDGSLASISGTVGSSAEISRHRFCFRNLSAESNTRAYSNSGDDWVFTGDTEPAARQIQQVIENYEPRPEGYEGQFIRFHESLEKGDQPPVTIQDARAVMEAITAVYHASRTAREVTLPIPADHPLYASLSPRT